MKKILAALLFAGTLHTIDVQVYNDTKTTLLVKLITCSAEYEKEMFTEKVKLGTA
jgi:hypothetical protein